MLLKVFFILAFSERLGFVCLKLSSIFNSLKSQGRNAEGKEKKIDGTSLVENQSSVIFVVKRQIGDVIK